MIEIEVDLTDVYEYAQHTAQIPASTPKVMARSINEFGEELKAGLVEYISAVTGYDPTNIESVTLVEPATPQNLVWKVDASQALITDANDWQRDWSSRPIDSNFEEQILLDIVTQPDCCDACAEYAQSPHTALEISNQAAIWKDFVPTGMSWLTALARAPVTNLLHPNCRCTTTQHDDLGDSGKLPVMFEGGDPQMLTCEEIGEDLIEKVMQDVDREWQDELGAGSMED